MSEKLLAEKIIVITGAGDGLGKALAIDCASKGATVVLLGRTLKKLEDVYDHIEDSGFPTPAIFPINFESATEPEYKNLHDVLDAEFGRVDAIIHNAAVSCKRSPVNSIKVDEWNKVMQINVNAPFQLSKNLIPLIQKSANGHIFFTSDSVGRQGKAYWGAYAVSKAAVENLMQTIADELEESSISVCSVNPQAVRTKMRVDAYPAEDPSTVPSAAEVAEKYTSLFSKDRQDLHGHALSL